MIIAQGERSAALGTRPIFDLAPRRGAATLKRAPKQILAIARSPCSRRKKRTP